MKYSIKDINKVHKTARNWLDSFLLDPVISIFFWITANFTSLTPNAVTIISLGLYIACGLLFLNGNLLLGGIAFYLGVLGDAIDGNLARLKFKPTKFGAWLDTWVDTVGQAIAAITLGYGYYLYTQNEIWLLLGGVMLFIKFHHNLESNTALKLMGDKRYKARVSEGNEGQDGIIGRIRKYLLKKRLRDPVSGSDIKTLFFVIGPIFKILDIILLIVIPIFIIKEVIWFIYYKRELQLLDKQQE